MLRSGFVDVRTEVLNYPEKYLLYCLFVSKSQGKKLFPCIIFSLSLDSDYLSSLCRKVCIFKTNNSLDVVFTNFRNYRTYIY